MTYIQAYEAAKGGATKGAGAPPPLECFKLPFTSKQKQTKQTPSNIRAKNKNKKQPQQLIFGQVMD